jgi:hypothetical protein
MVPVIRESRVQTPSLPTGQPGGTATLGCAKRQNPQPGPAVLRASTLRGIPPIQHQKSTNEAVNLLKINQITFCENSKAVNLLKMADLHVESRQLIENFGCYLH